MANSRSEDLFLLVQSLTKSEKRAFRVFARRIQDDTQLLYVQLFDLIDSQKQLDEEEWKRSLGTRGTARLANLKRHLYQQILISLRLLQKEKKANIKIREYIDFAYVLYDKGLYMQALRILEMGKKLAAKHHTDFSALMIIEIEKMIHSRHITRTDPMLIEALTWDATDRSIVISNRVKLSNLRLLLHKFYLEQGHVKNKEEAKWLEGYFAKQEPLLDVELLGTMERVYLFQSYVWYYYILNDFEQCFLYAREWVSEFKRNKELQARDVDLFLRGYHYLLTSAYNLKELNEFHSCLEEVESFRKDNYHSFNENTRIISFLYVHQARLNGHFLEGTFDEGLVTIKSTFRRINRYKNKLDEHKILVLYFKVAWMFLGNELPAQASEYLDKIIAITTRSLRDDIQTYARLMNLMAHFDLENFELLPSLLSSYSRFFEKVKQKNQVQITVLALFRDLAKAPILDRRQNLLRYHAQLKTLEQDQYERRAFLYLDILPWLEARIKNQSLSTVIRGYH